MPSGQSRRVHWQNSLAKGKVGYTPIPGGQAGWAGTLGGSGLAVSRSSSHPNEAIDFVRFLIREQIQQSEEWQKAFSITQPDDEAPVPDLGNPPEKMNHPRNSVVNRPSGVTGSRYEEITKEYIDTVHSVLTGQKAPQEAALELEKRLVKITGFRAGPPKIVD